MKKSIILFFLIIICLFSNNLQAGDKKPSSVPSDEEIVFMDDFQDNTKGWPEKTEANRKTSFEKGTFNGWYRYEQLIKKGSAVWLPVKIDTTMDFTIRCDTKWVSGDMDAGFGLIFCHKNWFYSSEFIINAKRGYKIYDAKNNDVGVLNWRTNNIINKKGVNALKVKRTGDLIEYFVNGRKVFQSAFRGFWGNNFGFVIFQPQVVLFDNLIITQSKPKPAFSESSKASYGNFTLYTPAVESSKVRISITPASGNTANLPKKGYVAYLDGILGVVKNAQPVNDFVNDRNNMPPLVKRFKTGGDYYYSIDLPYGSYNLVCSKYHSASKSYKGIILQQELKIGKDPVIIQLK